MAEILVIGGGIAGLSSAAELARTHQVTLLEREDELCYHSTGRSAAVYIEPYLEDPICRLTQWSRSFLESPTRWGREHSVLDERGDLRLAAPENRQGLLDYVERWSALCPSLRMLEAEELGRRLPEGGDALELLAVWNPDAFDIDVHGLSEAYRRCFATLGGTVLRGRELLGAQRDADCWRVETNEGVLRADLLVNAAGAWADTIAERCGLPPQGVTPMRRTIVQLACWSPAMKRWPMVHDAASTWYLKVDGERVLVSPSDQTPCAPVDAAPDEYDVALVVDRVERAFGISIDRVLGKWAGLRSFAPDHLPVIGRDPAEEHFVWCAGQGGYGIQTSPAFAFLTAHAIEGGESPAPPDIDPATFLPGRPGR